MHYFGWQGNPAETDSQIGQLLQLRWLQAYIECQPGPPGVSSGPPGPPVPVLGLFMEAEMVCVYTTLYALTLCMQYTYM